MGALFAPSFDGPISSSSAANVAVRDEWTWISSVMLSDRFSIAGATAIMMTSSKPSVRVSLIALGAFLDSHELVAPVAFESAGPFVERSDFRCVGAIEHLATVAPRVHQADIAKHAEMFGDRRL